MSLAPDPSWPHASTSSSIKRSPNGFAHRFESVEDAIERSTTLWATDLRSLFDHAKERFGDVSWETDSGDERIWGHKAVIYARAPKAFKDRYFLTRPFSRSPTLRSPSSSSSHLLPPLFSSSSTRLSPPSSYRNHSSLSVRTATSDAATLRGGGSSAEGVMRLGHGDTPELFQAQLEWLYTGDGFGNVVEWISEDADAGADSGSTIGDGGAGGGKRDSLGQKGSQNQRRDKLGQDLTYMWRSKLYVDVRIHLDSEDADTGLEGGASARAASDSDSSTDSLDSAAIFTAHLFILVSRSPYFSSLLLNTAAFLSPALSNGVTDVHLPSPPFTPASLHFCLGYIYAGHLDFSNRSFDLTTAFDIYRAAAYLQLDSLVAEITARIVWDFCHGSEYAKCRCRKCSSRVARVWRFASEDDIGNVQLAGVARRYLIHGWTECWAREVGLADAEEQDGLVQEVKDRVTARTIISTFKSIFTVRQRMENALRLKGAAASTWVDGLERMIEAIATEARRVLLDHFAAIAEGKELWDLLSGKGFSEDLLENIMKDLVDCCGTVLRCTEGPRVYQTLVSSILLKSDPRTLQTALPLRSRERQIIENAKDGIIAHIRRRWMQIRDSGGFHGLEIWALKEIADEIKVNDEDLLSLSTSPVPLRITPNATRAGIPRTTSRAISLSEISVSRISVASSSRIPLSPTHRDRSSTAPPAAAPESSGLRRLRLSSAASTSSAISVRSARPRETSPLATSTTGPQARSPTAAKTGNRVSIGSSRRVESSQAVNGTGRDRSPTPRPALAASSKRETLSGGIRPLVARGSGANVRPSVNAGKGKERAPQPDPGEALATDKTAAEAAAGAPAALRSRASSVASTRTTRTSRSTLTTTRRMTGSSSRPAKPSVPTGPITVRPKSVTPSDASVRTPRTSTARPAVPPLPSQVRDSTASTARTGGGLPGSASCTRLQSTASTASSRLRVESASTATQVRTRTDSAATVASSGSKAASAVPTAGGSLAPPRAAPSPAVSGQNKTAGPAAGAGTSARVSGLPPRKSRLGARTVPTAFPGRPEDTGLRVPNRSGSSSTAEDPETRTPRSSETSDPIIRLPSNDTCGRGSPILANLPAPGTELPPKTLPLPRTTRKVSTASVRSTMSARHGHPAAAFDPPRRPTTPVALDDLASPPGTLPFKGKGISLRVGIPCIVSLEGRRARFRAQVKYIGHLENAKGPWVGIEAEDIDRFGVGALPTGSRDGTHYFHLTRDDPMQSAWEAQAEAATNTDIRIARQRKIEAIRDGLRKSRLQGLGLGMNFDFFDQSKLPLSTVTAAFTAVAVGKRSTSPFLGPGGAGPITASGIDWIGSAGVKALFVRPSEVIYVVGAE